MNTQSDALRESPLESHAVAVISPGRRMLWSLRRELWENRSVYLAPLAVAALFIVGYLISTLRLVAKIHAGLVLNPFQQLEALEQPYTFAALFIMGTTFIVSFFYCLDALYGERRDRSILFWKSLPVSDLTTVLSKAGVVLVVLPLLTFAITVVTWWVTLLLSSVILLAGRLSVAELWNHLPLFQMSVMLLCPPLRLAIPRLSLGSSCALSLGGATPHRDRRSGEDCLQHFSFRISAGPPFQRRWAEWRL
jgi:ABC-2 type transport system permease protein